MHKTEVLCGKYNLNGYIIFIVRINTIRILRLARICILLLLSFYVLVKHRLSVYLTLCRCKFDTHKGVPILQL